MEYEKYVRKPFIVDVVVVTKENIYEIAKLVGQLREENGKPYIAVNNNVVPGIKRVHIGYYMTRMGDNIRCYNPRVFKSQFCPNTPEIEQWVVYIKDAIVKQEVGAFGRITETVTEAPLEELPQPEVQETVGNVEVNTDVLTNPEEVASG
jgi:hypothetical protein